jgi:transmembrane sensor
MVLLAFAWRESARPTVLTTQPLPVAATSAVLSPTTLTAQYETQKGQTRRVDLADGSVVILNTQTRLDVELTREHRLLRLVSGQAFFNVAHDTARAFTVFAGPIRVTAVGTRFDVRVTRERANVVLLEGRVRIDPLLHRGLARLLPVLDRHYLDSGQQLVARDGADVSIGAADVEQSTSWQQGRLVFHGESLEEAVAEFNRYSVHQLAIADPALVHLPVSGVFSSAHPENFLAAISSFYSVQTEDRGPQLTVLTLRAR